MSFKETTSIPQLVRLRLTIWQCVYLDPTQQCAHCSKQGLPCGPKGLASTRFMTTARATGHPYFPPSGPPPPSITGASGQRRQGDTNFLSSLRDAQSRTLSEPLPQSLEGRPLSVIVSGIEAQNPGAGLPRVWQLTNNYLLRQYQSSRPREPSFARTTESQSSPPIAHNADISSLPGSHNEASSSLQNRRLSHTIQEPYPNISQPQAMTDEGVSNRRGSSHSTHSLNPYSHQHGPPYPPVPNLTPEGSWFFVSLTNPSTDLVNQPGPHYNGRDLAWRPNWPQETPLQFRPGGVRRPPEPGIPNQEPSETDATNSVISDEQAEATSAPTGEPTQPQDAPDGNTHPFGEFFGVEESDEE